MNQILKKDGVIPFTQIPNEILCDESLSFKAKGLYAYMRSKPDGWDFSSNRIAKEAKEGRESVQSALRELRDANLLHFQRTKDGRGEYTLFIQKKPQSENPTEGKSLSRETPPTENPTDGKPDRYIIKRLNNKERESNKDKKNNKKKEIDERINRPALDEWLAYKKYKTQAAETKAINFLSKYDHATQQLIINTSIMNEWKGLFPPSGNNQATRLEQNKVVAEQWVSKMKQSDQDGLIDDAEVYDA